MPSSLPTPAPTPLPSYACDESDDKYLYKLIMTDTGGDGWGDVTYTITTDGATRFTGTLEDGYSGIRYFCIEDNVHTIVVNGSAADALRSQWDNPLISGLPVDAPQRYSAAANACPKAPSVVPSTATYTSSSSPSTSTTTSAAIEMSRTAGPRPKVAVNCSARPANGTCRSAGGSPSPSSPSCSPSAPVLSQTSRL